MRLDELPTNDAVTEADWREVFGDPGYEGGTANNGPQPFTVEQVTRVIWWHSESSEGVDIAGLFELTDGRYASVVAGCDTTGWDCQSSVTWSKQFNTLDEAVTFGLDRSAREQYLAEVVPVTPVEQVADALSMPQDTAVEPTTPQAVQEEAATRKRITLRPQDQYELHVRRVATAGTLPPSLSVLLDLLDEARAEAQAERVEHDRQLFAAAEAAGRTERALAADVEDLARRLAEVTAERDHAELKAQSLAEVRDDMADLQAERDHLVRQVQFIRDDLARLDRLNHITYGPQTIDRIRATLDGGMS
jgi:hypothetical protein